MITNELIVRSEIIQPLEINYNKEEIEKFITALEDKYKGVIVSETDITETKETISKINKIITTLKNYRLDNTKRAMKPLDSFINDFKDYEKRLDVVYRGAKQQLDEFDNETLKKQLDIMQGLKIRLCEEQGIYENLIEYIELPEQKNELSKSKFTEKKAAELIQINIDKVVNDYNIIKTNVDNANNRSNIKLNADNYIKYINNLALALQEIMNDENKYIEIEKRIMEEKSKISDYKPVEVPLNDKTINKSTNSTECEILQNMKPERYSGDVVVRLLITFNEDEIEKAKLLRKFLDDNAINYEKL